MGKRKHSSKDASEEEHLEAIALLQASAAAAEAKGDYAKALKRRRRLVKLTREDEDVQELEGMLHDGQMYLVDCNSGQVFTAERDDDGELVEVGRRDPLTRQVRIVAPPAVAGGVSSGGAGHEAQAVADGSGAGADAETAAKAAKLQRKLAKANAAGDDAKAAKLLRKLERLGTDGSGTATTQAHRVVLDTGGSGSGSGGGGSSGGDSGAATAAPGSGGGSDAKTLSSKKKKKGKKSACEASGAGEGGGGGTAAGGVTGYSGELSRSGVPFGKWFPNATRVPGAQYDADVRISIVLFYTYVDPLWSPLRQQEAIRMAVKKAATLLPARRSARVQCAARQRLSAPHVPSMRSDDAYVRWMRAVFLGCELNLGGRLRVAREGFNATVSGTHAGVRAFADALRQRAARELWHTRRSAAARGAGGKWKASRRERAARSCQPRSFDAAFADTDFKYIDDLPLTQGGPKQPLAAPPLSKRGRCNPAPAARRAFSFTRAAAACCRGGVPLTAFKDLSVFPVNELVHYGITPEAAPLGRGGVHLPAEEYHKKMKEYHKKMKEYHKRMKEDNTVIIDVRNAYESAIGHFQPPAAEATLATASGGGDLVDPLMRVSTEFPRWLAAEDTKAKLAGKNVLMYCTGGKHFEVISEDNKAKLAGKNALMYCTGGIRCERASALLRQEYGNDVGGVYQLQGGIEAYLKKFPEGGFWKGKNFTFDKRSAISAYAKQDTEKQEVLGECCMCAAKWDKYEGKRRCTTCPVPLLICQACLTKKADKDAANAHLLRCPLCKAEGKTVPDNRPRNGTSKTLEWNY
ncbi:hypothetical protein JKP88DRAFT_353964 [Tribonema minus]|uniref:Rhodanese domain-containing protein n=1 Tax=Tribonema minus TaxID=303371 RepID=A0A836CHR8_9STRA|nr:hypothetical protein JKP88DRAFT_353964 [Tribonema minus]